MPTTPFDTHGFIQSILDKGWQWSENHANRIVYPGNHEFYLRYDEKADRLTVSPDLDAHLELIIPTPASKGRFRG